MKRKRLAIGIMLLFIGVCFIPTNAQKTQISWSTAKGNWWYVGGNGPGNYTIIQDAVNASINGDTIFVYKGTYYEHVRIDKAISLLGEDMGSTIIDGEGNGSVVLIGANVTISFFTIQHSGDTSMYDAGIKNFVPNEKPYTFHIQRNCLKNNKNGIVLQNAHQDDVTGNIFQDNDRGIYLILTDDCTITQNNFINNTNHSFFEYFFFFQIFPRNNWNGNYWDNWHSKLPKPIRGFKEFVWIILRPGMYFTIPVPWINFDWHPAQEPYDLGG
jgi:parallel beta-helix repeat protein